MFKKEIKHVPKFDRQNVLCIVLACFMYVFSLFHNSQCFFFVNARDISICFCYHINQREAVMDYLIYGGSTQNENVLNNRIIILKYLIQQ